jgi:hypothetical protein
MATLKALIESLPVFYFFYRVRTCNDLVRTENSGVGACVYFSKNIILFMSY